MANLAQVRKDLAPSVNQQLRIVFVTTDPARDTPEVLGKWLEQIGGSIIGLTGTEEEIRRAQEAANVPPAYKEGEGEDYGVGHMAWVIAITPDDRVRLMYPFGTRQEDWAHDIPLLLAQYPAR
jgi:protein SCO1/2